MTFTVPLTSPERSTQERVGTEGGPEEERLNLNVKYYMGNIVIICGYMYSKIQYIFNTLAPATSPLDTEMLCVCVGAKTGRSEVPRLAMSRDQWNQDWLVVSQGFTWIMMT